MLKPYPASSGRGALAAGAHLLDYWLAGAWRNWHTQET